MSGITVKTSIQGRESTLRARVSTEHATPEALNVTENGTYRPPFGKTYDPINVAVPNTYAEGDEGKVVHEGALVEQSAMEITANDTYDTTMIHAVTVNVPNTYDAGDEGMVLVEGQLVAQTARTVDLNGTFDTTLNNSVTVDIQKKAPGDVTFYDYDGTVLYAYTAAQFAELTELPPNPVHAGLTAQGWNWSLYYAQNYVEDYGHLDIGQSYVTADGKTRIYITIAPDTPSDRMRFFLNFTGSGTRVDWGDGSAVTTGSGYHDYAQPGDYVITLTVNSGTLKFTGNSTMSIYGSSSDTASNVRNKARIRRIEIGDNVTQIGAYAFKDCYDLETITIPKNPGNDNIIDSVGNYAFYGCAALKAIVLPQRCGTVGEYAFYGCAGMSAASIGYQSASATIGTCAFYNCSALRSATLNNITQIAAQTFYGCASLQCVTMPNNVTQIKSNAFEGCRGLRSFAMPGKLEAINTSAFRNCTGLTRVYMKDLRSLTNINAYAFEGCYGISEYWLPNTGSIVYGGTRMFPPASSGVITAIYVRSNMVDSYKGFSNWSDYADVIMAYPA